MTLNERILDFMDGSLSPHDEAELLHTLSVSPEKRGVLRDFMSQKSLLASDRESLSVPYEAEQSLWARVDAILPAPQAITIPQPVGFFSRMMTTASAAVGALGLIVGLGAGYFAGTLPSQDNVQAGVISQTVSPVSSGLATAGTAEQNSAPRRTIGGEHAPLQFLPSLFEPNVALWNSPAEREVAPSSEPSIAFAEAQPVEPAVLHVIGTDGGNVPQFHNTPIAQPHKSLLERFEFNVAESFGRQFPNSAATNVSLPLITNSSAGAYFQVLPNSNTLWAGAAFGAANVTRKSLFTRSGNPIDPLQNVLASDTVHEPTNYVAALLQLRFPTIGGAELTFTGGYGFASLGQMMIGELGLHSDLTREVGFVAGLRAVRYSYDLTAQRDAAIRSGTGSLVVPNNVANASPSINIELNTGLYFHF